MTEIAVGSSASQTTKGSKTVTLFTDENLDDTTEHTSATADFNKLLHKTISIKTTHSGTLTEYFITVKIQTSDTDSDTAYRTLGTIEFEQDDIGSFSFDDSLRYLRITAQAYEGDGTNYVIINASSTALGE